MKYKTVPLEKNDVAKLDGDQLEELVAFGKTPAFGILNILAQEAKTKRAFEALEVSNTEDLMLKRGINVGTDFILDAVNRAKEELKSRGAQVDTEE